MERVAVVCLWARGPGAVAMLARREAAHLSAAGRQVLLCSKPGDAPAPAGTALVSLPTLPGGRWLTRTSPGGHALVEALVAVPDLRRTARGVDVVVCHGGLEGLALALALARLPGGRRVRVALRMHNFQRDWRRRGRSTPPSSRLVYAVADRVAVARADVVVPVSRALGAEVAGATGAAVVPRPNGVPRRAAPEGARDVDVLFVGRLVDEKGVDRLPGVAAALRPGERLVVAGDGPRSEHLRSDPAVAGAAELLGAVSHERAQELMGRARVLLVPSTDDPYPTVVLEGMDAGCCVVASRVGGVPEMIDDGHDGLVVEPGAAGAWGRVVRQLLDDPERCAALGRAARSSAQRFDEELTVPEVVRAYLGG